MIEEDAVARVQAVAAAVKRRHRVGILLRDRVGRHGLERARLRAHAVGQLTGCLRPEREPAEQLRRGRLIEAALRPREPHDLEQPQHPHGVDARGMLRLVERDAHVAFAREVVDLVGLHPDDHRLQAERIDQVAVMQLERQPTDLRGGPQVIDPVAVQAARPPHEAVHGIALVEQQLGQIGAVLSADTGDERRFHATQSGTGAGFRGAGSRRRFLGRQALLTHRPLPRGRSSSRA